VTKVKEFDHFKEDGAPRDAHAAQARALRERLRGASDTITLGILDHFSHFRHFFKDKL
jgi:hypothetical protein